MRKGMALIKARDLIGPSASVRQDGVLFYVDARQAVSVAHSWEQALQLAGDSQAARDFHDEQVRIANEIGNAKKSLAATGMEIAKKKYQEFMQRMANIEQDKGITLDAKREADLQWQKEREESYQAALKRTRERAA